MAQAAAPAWGAGAELLSRPKPHTRPFQARLNGALRLRCSIKFGFRVPRIWHHCRQFELLTYGPHGALAGQTNGEVEGPRESAGRVSVERSSPVGGSAAGLEPRVHTVFLHPRRHYRVSRTPPTIVRRRGHGALVSQPTAEPMQQAKYHPWSSSERAPRTDCSSAGYQ